MKRSTFLSLLSRMGFQASAFNYGAFGLPSDQCSEEDPEMPDGYQSMPDGSRMMWGTNHPGRIVQFPVCASFTVNRIFTAKDGEKPRKLDVVPMLTGFHLPAELGDPVGWMALVDWKPLNPDAPYLKQALRQK
jgi:hypothetical protein